MSKRQYPDRPIVGVGALVIKDGKVLLVKRGVEPSCGRWAIPGGTLELGESLKEGAQREMLEETGVAIRARDPFYTFDFFQRDDDGRLRFHFVIVDLDADYISGEPKGADDAADARWLTPDDLRKIDVTGSTLRVLRMKGFLK